MLTKTVLPRAEGSKPSLETQTGKKSKSHKKVSAVEAPTGSITRSTTMTNINNEENHLSDTRSFYQAIPASGKTVGIIS